jgi:hypothetical protein
MNPKISVIILNDIFLCKVDTNQYNNNLMFAKFTSQCPFVSATCVFDERGTNVVNNIGMLLALHPPQIVTIVFQK